MTATMRPYAPETTITNNLQPVTTLNHTEPIFETFNTTSAVAETNENATNRFPVKGNPRIAFNFDRAYVDAKLQTPFRRPESTTMREHWADVTQAWALRRHPFAVIKGRFDEISRRIQYLEEKLRRKAEQFGDLLAVLPANNGSGVMVAIYAIVALFALGGEIVMMANTLGYTMNMEAWETYLFGFAVVMINMGMKWTFDPFIRPVLAQRKYADSLRSRAIVIFCIGVILMMVTYVYLGWLRTQVLGMGEDDTFADIFKAHPAWTIGTMSALTLWLAVAGFLLQSYTLITFENYLKRGKMAVLEKEIDDLQDDLASKIGEQSELAVLCAQLPGFWDEQTSGFAEETSGNSDDSETTAIRNEVGGAGQPGGDLTNVAIKGDTNIGDTNHGDTTITKTYHNDRVGLTSAHPNPSAFTAQNVRELVRSILGGAIHNAARTTLMLLFVLSAFHAPSFAQHSHILAFDYSMSIPASSKGIINGKVAELVQATKKTAAGIPFMDEDDEIGLLPIHGATATAGFLYRVQLSAKKHGKAGEVELRKKRNAVRLFADSILNWKPGAVGNSTDIQGIWKRLSTVQSGEDGFVLHLFSDMIHTGAGAKTFQMVKMNGKTQKILNPDFKAAAVAEIKASGLVSRLKMVCVWVPAGKTGQKNSALEAALKEVWLEIFKEAGVNNVRWDYL